MEGLSAKAGILQKSHESVSDGVLDIHERRFAVHRIARFTSLRAPFRITAVGRGIIPEKSLGFQRDTTYLIVDNDTRKCDNSEAAPR